MNTTLPDELEALATQLDEAWDRRYGTTPQRGVAHPEAFSRQPILRSRWLVPAIALALLVACGVAVAAVTGSIPWWQNAAPPANQSLVDQQLAPAPDGRSSLLPPADRSEARTVARADGATLVAAPEGQSGYCLIPSLPGLPDIDIYCQSEVVNPASGDEDDFRSYARPASAGTPRWILYGRINDPAATTLDLSQAAGVPFKIALQPSGFFLANIPANRWSALTDQAGPGAILDASGATIRTGCVNWGPSPDSPGAGLIVYPFWSNGPGPCLAQPLFPMLQARPDYNAAHVLVELTLTSDFSKWTQGATIALWEAPGLNGGACIFEALAGETPTPPAGSGDNPASGGGCTQSGTWPTAPGTPIATTLESGRTANGSFAEMLRGHVDPASGITKLTLQSATATIPVSFASGWFLAQLPNSNTTQLPAGGPYTLAGYDSAGNQIASENLNQLETALPNHG